MDNFLRKLIELPKVQLVLLAIIPIAGIAAAMIMLVITPQFEEVDSLKSDISNLNTQVVKNRGIAKNLPVFKKEYENLKAQLQESLKKLPEKSEIPNLLTSIAMLAKEMDLEIIKFTPGGEVRREFYADVPVKLKVSGSYHDLALFFQELGDLERIVNVDKLAISKAGGKGQGIQLQVDFVATTYRFVDAPAPEKDKKKGKKK